MRPWRLRVTFERDSDSIVERISQPCDITPHYAMINSTRPKTPYAFAHHCPGLSFRCIPRKSKDKLDECEDNISFPQMRHHRCEGQELSADRYCQGCLGRRGSSQSELCGPPVQEGNCPLTLKGKDKTRK